MPCLRRAADRGFTLIELLIVILIVGILAAVALPAFLSQSDKGKNSEAVQTLRNAYSIAKAAATSNDGDFPSASELQGTIAESEKITVELKDDTSDLTSRTVTIVGAVGDDDLTLAFRSSSGAICQLTVLDGRRAGPACGESASAEPPASTTPTTPEPPTSTTPDPPAPEPVAANPADVATQAYGQPTMTSSSANNGGVSAGSLYGPRKVLAAEDGIYVSDYNNNRVLFYPGASELATRVYGQPDMTTGANPAAATASTLWWPHGMTFTPSGDLAVISYGEHRLVTYPSSSTTATGVLGQPSLTSGVRNSGGLSAQSLGGPGDVAYDASGGRYIADSANHRVLYFPAGSSTATRVYGQGGSFETNAANKGSISADTLNWPSALAVDDSGLYVSDSQNNRVLFYPGSSTTASRVYGQSSFTASTANYGGRSASTLSTPAGLSVDEAGNLFVADAANHRVLRYPAGSTTASRLWGQTTFTTATVGTGPTGMNLPHDVEITASGGMYVAEHSGHRVTYFPAQ